MESNYKEKRAGDDAGKADPGQVGCEKTPGMITTNTVEKVIPGPRGDGISPLYFPRPAFRYTPKGQKSGWPGGLSSQLST